MTETTRLDPIKRTTYSGVNYAVIDIDAENNGGKAGRMLQFFHPQTGELVDFPMDVEDAQKMGRQLIEGPDGGGGKPVPDLPPTPEAGSAQTAEPVLATPPIS